MLSDVIKGRIVANMLKGNLTIVCEEVSCDGVSCSIVSNGELEDVFPTGLGCATANGL